MSTGSADTTTSPAPPPSDLAKLDAACAKGMELQLAGQVDLAQQLYRAVLQAHPRHAAANYCFGMLQVQLQRPLEGLPHLVAALEVSPQISEYWLGYLEALLLAGRIGEAKSTLALGVRHGLSGKELQDFTARLSARSSEVGKQERTLTSLLRRQKFPEALALARAMTERFTDCGLGFKVLGAFISAERKYEQALAPLQTAVRLLPQDAEAHVNLGLNFAKLDRLNEAETEFKRAIELDPDQASAHFRLAMAYGLRNRYVEAEASLRRGFELKGDYVEGDADLNELSFSSFLFIVSHNPMVDADALFAQHCRVGEFFEKKQRRSWPRHPNLKDPERRLKVGFVSGDLYQHAVSFFVEPVLEQLRDHSNFDLHAYYNNVPEDAVTRRLQGYFQGWSRVSELKDAALAKKIRDDGIDILFDLSGHSGANRLPVFARKPAPIQVSWVGYPGTTGLRAIDYYIADRFFLPPGQFDRHFTEKIVYLPANVPFRPFQSAPPINDLPALRKGSLVFASFNRLGKINSVTLDTWAALLAAVPDAAMLVGAIDMEAQQTALIAEFEARGIARDRLTFHPRCNVDVFLKLHYEVDICLDTYPYTGGTTTIQALWMGVPTLTVAGPTPAARQGAAILGQLGLDEFIAADAADLARKGRYWAAHLERLAGVRSGLRDRWQQSPARQPKLIATALEEAVRRMWRRWCEGLEPESF